jgi:hypothetical protein
MNKDPRQATKTWEETLSRALQSLPERPAPPDLLPQVMARVRAGAAGNESGKSWLQRALWLRVAASLLLSAPMLWVFFLGNRFYETDLSPALNRSAAISRTVLGAIASALGGTHIVIDADVCRTILLAGGLILISMYLTCIGVGTFIYRTVRR